MSCPRAINRMQANVSTAIDPIVKYADIFAMIEIVVGDARLALRGITANSEITIRATILERVTQLVVISEQPTNRPEFRLI